MPSLRQIRRRIGSVRNTAKVTKAMEMVAASKMRRAQQRVLAARPYAERMEELLGHLAAQVGPEEAPVLLQRRPAQRVLVVEVTPDRGLCGGLPGNLNRATSEFLVSASAPAEVVVLGRRGRDFMVRYGADVRAVFGGVGDRPGVVDTNPIAHFVIQEYESGRVDEVYLAYPRFESTMTQYPVVEPLLPVEPRPVAAAHGAGYIYEPSGREVLEALLPRFVEMQVYRAVLEEAASEQSARMVAMRNATENANEMVEELTLHLNKVRQATITNELLDIAGGVAALES